MDEQSFNAIEVVPSSWVHLEDTIEKCLWPDKNARKFIKKQTVPKNNWEKYTITVLLRTESYQNAIDFVKKKTKTDTDTSCSQLGRGKRKRKKNSVTDDYDSCSDYDSNLTPPPSITVHVNDVDLETNEFRESTNESNSRKKSDDQNGTKFIDPHRNNIMTTDHEAIENLNPNENRSTELFKDNSEYQRTNIEKNISQVQQSNIEEIMDISQPNNIIIENLSPIHADNHNILLILENVISIRRMLEQQNDFLIRMENKNDRGTALAATGINRKIAESIIPVRPFKKYNELIAFDEILNTNEEGKKQMETFFYLLGGASPRDEVKAGLEKIFSNRLAKKCSWLGRKGNFPINKLIVIDVLKNSTRRHFPYVTEKNFQDYVSVWFRHAVTRYEREKAKAAR
ncbi:uncharacterized protein [Linepithema humile]